ncbi:DUF305 domain-containing protein [Actinocorallia longicatena]|uniref:DUF305 domain-containing protein n=1 Tax=Actinocorallia longicatena TaxID=111803 RepID=A0ABP6Q2Q1_9ACTN
MNTMKRVILPVAVLALALTGCSGGDSGSHDGHGGGKSAAAAPGGHNPQDVMFAQEMVPHHKQALEMAVLAETRAESPEVRKIAARIKGAQDPEITAMTGWLKGWNESPSADHEMSDDTGGNGMMSTGEMEELGGLKGAAFDQLFLELMIKHHQGAVAMAGDEVDSGSFGPAKALAQKIVDGQTAEITEMRALLKP